MKRTLAAFVIGALTLAGTGWAQENDKPLGHFNIALKGDYLTFTDSAMKDNDLEKAPYGGAEAYFNIFDGVYIGAEGGYAQAKGTVNDDMLGPMADSKITYIPLEANAKIAFGLASWLALDVGAGGSYNNAKVEFNVDGYSASDTKWVLGGQAFADLNFVFGAFMIGVNGKYQLTDKIKDTDVKLTNWRVGGQIGLAF